MSKTDIKENQIRTIQGNFLQYIGVLNQHLVLTIKGGNTDVSIASSK